MSSKKTSVRKQYEKKIKHHIRDLQKRGLNVENVTKGKNIEQLSWSKKTYDIFMDNKRIELRRENRTKTGLKKEVTEILKEQIKKVDRQTLNILKNNGDMVQFKDYTKMNSKELKSFIEEVKKSPSIEKKAIEITKAKAEEFLRERYFKEFKLEPELQERLDKLIDSFGSRLSDLDDFTQEITRLDFKEYTDGEDYLKYDSVDSYREHMEKMLDKVEQLIQTKYSKVLSNRFKKRK